MAEFQLKFNGIGNAWPLLIGQTHPFYDRENFRDMANASFSFVEKDSAGNVLFEVLIDGGQGIVQEILATSNRVPEMMVITHPHFDHIASLDWISRSYYVKYAKQKKFPVYCTRPCFETIMQSFPHLNKIVRHCEVYPGKPEKLRPDGQIKLTAFPVYHGDSANGAMMYLFETGHGTRTLITGDILFPFIRSEDIDLISGVDYLVTDANNRFPYPLSNHWSVISSKSPGGDEYERLAEFRKHFRDAGFSMMYRSGEENGQTFGYLSDVLQNINFEKVPMSIIDFALKIKPAKILPVHYSGGEDEKYYFQPKLDRRSLMVWLTEEAKKHNLNSVFEVPRAGDIYPAG